MFYWIKYHNMKPIVDERDGIMRGDHKAPCIVCGRKTAFIDIDWSKYVLTDEMTVQDSDLEWTDQQKLDLKESCQTHFVEYQREKKRIKEEKKAESAFFLVKILYKHILLNFN